MLTQGRVEQRRHWLLWSSLASPMALVYLLATCAIYSILEKWGVACLNLYIFLAASWGIRGTLCTLWNV